LSHFHLHSFGTEIQVFLCRALLYVPEHASPFSLPNVPC